MPDELGLDRQQIDLRESLWLAPYALFSRDTAGRAHAEPEHRYRGPFQRDRDRILHSAAFRRLNGKTQVFTGSMGDYHRTRLTHTMEVSSIARTLGRAFRLNEDLIEALALLHDIGHPPFGHAGEDTLRDCLQDVGGFSHNQFALTLVCELEHPYADFPGLNLCYETLESQRNRVDKQSADRFPLLEAQVVDVADSITYDAHDVDDAVKLQLLTLEEFQRVDLMRECYQRVGRRHPQLSCNELDHAHQKLLRRALVHELIELQVSDVVRHSLTRLQSAKLENAQQARRSGILIEASPALSQRKKQLEKFLYENVYRHPQIVAGRERVQGQLREMFDYLVAHGAELPPKFQQRRTQMGLRVAVGDYLAGMTDRYFLRKSEELLGGTRGCAADRPSRTEP